MSLSQSNFAYLEHRESLLGHAKPCLIAYLFLSSPARHWAKKTVSMVHPHATSSYTMWGTDSLHGCAHALNL